MEEWKFEAPPPRRSETKRCDRSRTSVYCVFLILEGFSTRWVSERFTYILIYMLIPSEKKGTDSLSQEFAFYGRHGSRGGETGSESDID